MRRFIPFAIAITVLIAAPVAALGLMQGSIIYHPHTEEVAPNFPETEAVRITTGDGERIVAWYRAPQAGQPVYLFFDGNGGRPQIWAGRWRRIAETGAGFLAVYYRGYSGSTGAPSERGLHLDARAGYDWLIARGYTPGDIVIHGFSLGSAAAMKLASERPARALILEAPFTGVDDVAAEVLTPLLTVLIRDSFRSREWIGDVRMPVLIVHGDADTAFRSGTASGSTNWQTTQRCSSACLARTTPRSCATASTLTSSPFSPGIPRSDPWPNLKRKRRKLP